MLSSILLPSGLCLLSAIITPARAQFQWQFNKSVTSTSLATCVSQPITVKPFNTTLSNSSGVPPYYMTAFAIGGTPTTTLIGTDASSLSWTVTQPVGTRLMLSVVDAVGSEGGIPADIYEVTAGQTTSCVVTPSATPEFTITSNITGNLATCQPWGLTLSGGVAPYNITLASLDARVVTNITLPSGDNHFTYINRAPPGAQLLAAASDSTGRWASGTPMLTTQGSSNTDCNGLSSSSDHSTSTILQSSTSLSHSKTESGTPQQTGLATVNATRMNKTPLIVGVTVPLVVIFVLGGSVLALLYLRKRRTRQAEKEDPLQPRQFRIEEESQRQAVNHTETPSPSGKHLAASRHAHSPATASNAMPSGSTTASSIPSGTSGVSSSNSTPSQTRPTQRTDATSEDVGPGEGETVFQHRDAAVVREIPPPYADSQSRPSS